MRLHLITGPHLAAHRGFMSFAKSEKMCYVLFVTRRTSVSSSDNSGRDPPILARGNSPSSTESVISTLEVNKPQKTFVYNITTGTRTDEVRGRRHAVEHARTLSAQRHSTVRVERTDRAVEMIFRGGSLQQYCFNMQPGRR